MKVNHESPLSILDIVEPYNDYFFVLPHLLDESKQYQDYVMDLKHKGHYLIMDNSLHELGTAYPDDRLFYWIKELEPNEFLIPDVWEDKTQTLVNAKKWLSYDFPINVKKVGIVQATTLEDAMLCYNTLKIWGYEKIAFNYGNYYYRKLFPSLFEDEAFMLGRIYTIYHLYKLRVIESNDKIHLLGCRLPQEFTYYKPLPFIESIDTSSPIMAAMDGIVYNKGGIDKKPKTNINKSFWEERKNINLELVKHNLEFFKYLIK